MYLQSVLQLVLLCVLVAEVGTVQAKETVSLASFDEEAKLRSVQDERRFESVPSDDEETALLVPGPQMSSTSIERRRGWFKKLRRKLKRSVKKRWKRLKRSVKKRWKGWAVRGARWYINRRWGRRG